jgi:hypothetical protein
MALTGTRPKKIPECEGEPSSPDDPLYPLELKCIEWFRTGRLSTPSWEALPAGARDIEKTASPRLVPGGDERRAVLLAWPITSGNDRQRDALRARALRLRPAHHSGISAGPVLQLLDLASPTGAERWRGDAGLRRDWAFGLVNGAYFSHRVCPHLAVGIRFCQAMRIDVAKLVQQAIVEIDSDLYEASTKPRVTVPYPPVWFVARGRGAEPRLEFCVQLKGRGGRLSAGPAMPLYHFTNEFTVQLMRIADGATPLKEIARARSKQEVASLLGDKNGVVSARIELAGKLSIDSEDLRTYQTRLDCAMEWVRGCFPGVRARAEIVAS